ncbi:MAG TPA: hypothetical protein VLA34_02420, partial [Candidatus Krumholzibacterium sp.]|nr:hypothetical protein [Candidatus Krumholzibacterium sp.]
NDERYLNWAKKVKSIMPRSYKFEEGKVPLPFPVLVDAERTVSKGLDLFRTEWDKSEVDQNISSVYIIDAKGRLQFKYVSQNTFDRPPLDYITRILDTLL